MTRFEPIRDAHIMDLTFGYTLELDDINDDLPTLIIVCDCTQLAFLIVRNRVQQDVVGPPYLVGNNIP